MSNWWDAAPVVAGPQAAPAPAQPQPVAQPAPQGEANWWEQAPAVAAPPPERNVLGKIRDFVTGDNRREFDYPEFDPLTIKPQPSGMPHGEDRETRHRVDAMANYARTDKAKLDILSTVRPDLAATAELDKFGNISVLGPDGTRRYLNRPGFSKNDVSEALGAANASMPAAIATGPFFSGAGLLARMGLSGLVGAEGSVTQDLQAGAHGSKQGVDPGAAVMSGMAGAGFEMAAPWVGSLFRSLASKGRDFIDPATGKLTEMGIAVLRKAGYDPDQVTQAFARQFGKMAKTAANPEDAARAAGPASLPVPIPATKGDITGSPSQQMFESLAEKGAYGPTAENVMGNAVAAKQAAVRANVPAIQGRLSGGAPQVLERGQAGAQAQTALGTARDAEKAAVDAAYDAARSSNAGFNGSEPINRLYGEIVNNEGVGSRLQFSPKTQALLTELQGLGKDGSGVPARALYAWRRKVSTLANEATDPTEKAALTAAKRQFDDSMDGLVSDAMMSGDPEAVKAWKTAIDMRAAFGKKWQAGDIVERLTARNPDGSLKVAPEAASNLIFNSKEAGFITAPELVRGMDQLKKVLPPEQWNAIREEAFLRLAQQGEGAYSGATRLFSGVNFKKAWDNFQMKNAPLMRVLFDKEERSLISQFANEAARATGKVRGGDNFSNTAVGMSNLLQRVRMLPFGEKMAALIQGMPLGGQIYRGAMTARAVGATNAGVPQIGAPVAGVLGDAVGPPVIDYTTR